METKSHKSRSKILLVDDHALIREGLLRVLNHEKDLHVCAEASDAAEALRELARTHPDLAVVDLSLEGGSGFDLIKQMVRRAPKLRILVLSIHNELLHAERTLQIGAHGYIMKREPTEKIVAAMRQVLQGRIYVSPAMNERMLQRVSSPAGDAGEFLNALTDREFEVFRLIGQGYGTRQIAEELMISIKTAESHRERIREKLNLRSTFELTQRAIHWFHREPGAH